MRIIILFAFIIIALNGCNNDERIKEGEIIKSSNYEIIKPNISFDNKINILPYIDSIKYVTLELTDESIIGNIQKLIVYNDRIYILDTQSSSLFVFDIKGKYLFKIDKIGSGPGEYTQLDFFDIDYKNNHIILTDLMTYWAIRYDMNGQYLYRKKIPVWIEGITPLPNKGMVAYANYRNNKETLKQECNLLYLDSLMQIRKVYFPYNSDLYKPNGISFTTPQTGCFYTYNDSTFFFTPYNNEICKISENELILKYSFDFGEKKFNTNLLEQPEKLKEYMRRGEFYTLTQVFENDQILFFSISEPAFPFTFRGYYSKSNKNTLCSVFYTIGDNELFDGSANILSTYNSWFIAEYNISSLIGWSNNIDKKKIIFDNIFLKERKQIAESLSPEDNPVLMFYKFKSI
ncbi:6-bladed beta-propeller [Parabacteroides sp. Marseille-P3160]|uniref:6-bladed beta-propeller n=1 Tax=Parabacteroides sp. Marseille-P3160 TaxID=1917887 RepID=UPI0013576F63|nr:6-bladed beta-propeller [Parabacteroides sp. Marseille-P3160]